MTEAPLEASVIASASMLAVAVETPRHSAVGGLLDYASERPLAPGTLLRVPLGRREVAGLVWPRAAHAMPPAPRSLKPIATPRFAAASNTFFVRCCSSG